MRDALPETCADVMLDVAVIDMDPLLHIYTPAASMVALCGHRCPSGDQYGIPVDLTRRHCAECVETYRANGSW